MKRPHSNKTTNQMATIGINIQSLKWSLFNLGTYKLIIITTQYRSMLLFGWNSEIPLKQNYLLLPSSGIFIINGWFSFFNSLFIHMIFLLKSKFWGLSFQIFYLFCFLILHLPFKVEKKFIPLSDFILNIWSRG